MKALKREAASIIGSFGRLIILSLLFFPSCSTLISKEELSRCAWEASSPSLPQGELITLSKKGFVDAKVCLGKELLKESPSASRRFLLEAYESSSGERKGYVAYLIGLTYLKEGKKVEARRWFFKANLNGYPNREFFRLTSYLSLKEIKELKEAAERAPKIYLYMGDYFLEGALPDAAFYYYQFAVRHGIREARLKSAVALFETGNWKLAYSILTTEYEKGDKEAAKLLGELFERKAFSVGKGSCLLVERVPPEEFLLQRGRQIKERALLLKKSSEWFSKAGLKEEAERVKGLSELYSFKRREELKEEWLKLSEEELERLCEEGKLWAEYLLALRLKELPSSRAAAFLYGKLFKLP